MRANPAGIPRPLHTRLIHRAYNRALYALRDTHRDEFEHLVMREREAIGLYRDGAVDLRLAREALGEAIE